MYRGPRRPYPSPRQSAPRGGGYPPYQSRGPTPKVERHPLLESLNITDKFSFWEVNRPLIDLYKRFPRRQTGQDLTRAVAHFATKSKGELQIPLNVSIDYNLKSAGTCTVPEPAPTKPHEENGVPTRYFVRVIILSGAQEEDQKAKTKLHLSKRLMLLLARKEHAHVMPIGAEWSADKDGAEPNDASLKKTAMRAAKELLDVDLSSCTRWIKFVEFWYNREDNQASKTVVFIPNVWDHFKEGLHPNAQVREEDKEVSEEVEEEEEDPEDSTKKRTIKKKVTTTKKVKVVELRPYEMSLYSLLEYDCTRTSPDELVELCLFADCFDEMIQRDMTLDILEILKQKKAEVEEIENEKKRKREAEEAEAAAKKQKTEEEAKEEQAKEEKAKEEVKEEKPKTMIQHHVNQEILTPFQYLDKQPPAGTVVGHLKRDTVEAALYQLGQLTRQEIDDLLNGNNLKRAAGFRAPPPVLYYIKLATTTKEVPCPPTPEKEKPEEEAKETVPAAVATPETAAPTVEETPTPTEGGEAMEEDKEEEEEEALSEENLSKLLLKDLRTMCESRGLPSAGKKAELVERLLKQAQATKA